MIETPVLIVGGGPVGLAMAIELGWRGIGCTLIEQDDGTVDHPRLGIILGRTMEMARRWGIVDRIYDCGFNQDYPLNVVYCTSLAGFELGRDSNPGCGAMPRPPQSPEKRQRCPQIWFNPILQKAAGEYPHVAIRHFCRLDSYTQDENGITAQVSDPRGGAAETIRAKYLVACDGAGSIVRRSVDVPMDGTPILSYSVNLFVRSKAMLTAHGLGPAERYIFVGANGTWANMTVVDGRELWRFTIIGSAAMMDLDSFDAHAAIAKCTGIPDLDYELISIKPWRRTELTAREFRHGRVFLAGDAAHTMSPTGGHGMNTGLGDVANLGWKLEAVLKGEADDALLDSYTPERRAVAAHTAATSAKNFRNWISATDTANIMDDTAEGAATRARVGAHMLQAGREDWDSIGVQLGYRYDESPIIVPDGTPAPAFTVVDYEQTARPGARAPHAWLADGRSTLDLFGHGFVLLRFGDAAVDGFVDAARRLGVTLGVVEINDPAIAALYAGKLVLVRPDGHVAWRGDAAPADAEAILSTVSGANAKVPA